MPRRFAIVSLCWAMLVPCIARAQAGTQTCDSVKVECCSLRPSYSDTAYSSFTGTIAAATYWSPNLAGFDSNVLSVYNFLNQGAAPIGVAGPWLTPRYDGPPGAWQKGKLGTIFGLTIDDQGNIYVASSSCYYSDYFPGNLSGRIWKIDANTGAPTQFNVLPNFPDGAYAPGQNLPGLGNISFDCDHHQLFVTNEEDGKIYRLSMVPNAAPLQTYDHGAPDNGLQGWAPLGERLWAVQYHAGRVYYSVWAEDQGRPSATAANEIWSVALNGSGAFVAGSQRLELSVPPLGANNYSNPVSDISFGPAGQMLIAERSMYDDTQPSAHQSRLLEYICGLGPAGKTWLPSGYLYGTGAFDVPAGTGSPSSAGGCDYDLGVGARVWCSADAVEFGPDYVYGLQGLPNTGGDMTNSITIDDNGMYAGQDKTEIGDVEISCQDHPTQISELCGIKFIDINGDGIMNGADAGAAGWTIALNGPGGPQTTVTGPGGFYCFQNLLPGTYTVHEVAQPGFTQTAPTSVSYTFTVPPGTGGLNFGNYRNCQTPSIINCTAGKVDTFRTSDGPEPSSPSPALLAVLNACSPGQPPLTLFDVIPCRQCFGHTFDKCWADSCVVIGAQVQMRLRAGDCQPGGDSLCFMLGGQRVWCLSLNTLQNLATGGADPTWSPGDDNTFNLNLASLPPDANGVTNILAALQTGQLGVFIHSATGVDYINLRVQVCCPNGCIQGHKFNDLNHNGVWDAGEPPLANWTITLTGPVNATTTTDANGNWSFCNLPAGQYVVHEVNQPNWINTAPTSGTFNVNLPAGTTLTGFDFGNWRCIDLKPCTRAPNCMVAWWPLDESVGPVSDDIALNNVGFWVGNPVVIPGIVGNALRLNTGSDFVRVNNHPSLNFGQGDLAIDAWVRFQTTSSGVRTIVDHRGGTSSNPVGYVLFTFQDRLGFQLGDGSPTFNWIAPSGTTLTLNAWHHVAASVCRSSHTGGKLYVDGNVVLTFDPTIRPGNTTNASPLFIGQQTIIPAGLLGDVDEVEVFRCCLDSARVASIWAAGPSGKCKQTAFLPSPVAYCLNQTTLNTTLTLCNSSGTPQNMTWSLAGLPASPPQCTIAGPTVFTPASGTVVVPANGCINIPIAIQRPPGLVPGQRACYQVTVLNNTSGGPCITATGTLTAVNKFCIRLPDPNILTAPFPNGVAFELGVTNIDQTNQTIPYQIVVLGDDDQPDNQSLRLNGLPPGEPVIGTLTLHQGDSFEHLLRVSVDPVFHNPGAFYRIVLEADTDGDGQYEPLVSVSLRTALPEDMPGGVGPRPATEFAVKAQPNPFTTGTDISFATPRTGTVSVRVYDLLGRLVATLQDGALAAGSHTYLWNGRDLHGNLVGHGIYLVRVHAGEQVATTKVVRMR